MDSAGDDLRRLIEQDATRDALTRYARGMELVGGARYLDRIERRERALGDRLAGVAGARPSAPRFIRSLSRQVKERLK